MAETNIDKIAVTVAKDGTATLTGINCRDLLTLLTAASLYDYDDKPKADPLTGDYDDVVHDNNIINFRYHLDRRLHLDVVETKLKAAISPQYNKDDISRIKSMYEYAMKNLDECVGEAEVEAAKLKAGETPNHAAIAVAELAQMLRQADSALAKLQQAMRP